MRIASMSATMKRDVRALRARLPRHRIRDDEVVPRDMREAAEVDHIGEAVAAGCKALVAASRHRERIAHQDRLRRALPQLDQHAVERDAMNLHLDGKARVRTACEAELASGEPAVDESVEPSGVKR